MAGDTVIAFAMAMILASPPPLAFGLAVCSCLATITYIAQAQASVVKFAKQTGFAQAQAEIV